MALTWPASALADSNTDIIADNQEETYRRCLAATTDNAAAAMDMALRWSRLGGSSPAKHCQAVALQELGDFEQSASLLQALASERGTTPGMRTELWTQAGRMWMNADAYDKAITAFDNAATLNNAPDTVLLDRAIAFAAIEQFWAAVDDLNTYLDIHPDDTAALTLRGSAYRHLGSLALAQDDVSRALAIEPTNINAWLEHGIIRETQGDEEGARESWLKVLDLGPDSPAADIVRARIEAAALTGEALSED